MPKFTLEKIKLVDEVDEVNPFFKLMVNGKCQFDQWWKEMELAGNYSRQLIKINVWMTNIACGEPVPGDKFKPLSGRKKGDNHQDHEIKVGDLRVYLFKDKESGNVIVTGAIKKGTKAQNKDIERMRTIKKEYFNSK
jgi:hypothetical protein